MSKISQPQHLPQKVCWIMLFILTLSGASISAAQTETPEAASYDADVATAWMALIYDLVRAEGINVPAAARIYDGYSGVTLVFEFLSKSYMNMRIKKLQIPLWA